MKRFYVLTLSLAVASSVLVQPSIRPILKNNGYVPFQSSSDNEIGIAEYPQMSYLPEATERLLEGKASTWLLARVYHTDDSIKNVTKYFKAQAHQVNKPVEGNAILKSLLRDNWKIDKRGVRSVATVFGVGSELRESALAENAETSFGLIVLDDSIVRVHLMSPHPTSTNPNKLASGTMIVMVRERLSRQPEGATNESSTKVEKAYTGREVTRQARVKSKPEPEYARTDIIGTVALIAAFRSTGKVTDIRVVSGLPGGLTEAAIEAAKKIKFEPAIKDGRYVTQWVRLEYNFKGPR